jgi:hypothetical protein
MSDTKDGNDLTWIAEKERKVFCAVRFEEFNELWEKYRAAIQERLSSNEPLTYEELQVCWGLPIEALKEWQRSQE